MNHINSLIFRAYDIRGIADADLTEDSMYLIGLGAGTYLQNHYGKNLVVGRDNRTHGEKLQNAFIKGLLDTGANVTNIGLSTSPMLYYTVCKYDFDGGANITASHNPKEYNGIKLVGKNAHSVCGDDLQEVLKIIQNNEFIKGKGILTKKDIFTHYIEDFKKHNRSKKPLKIIIDAGNGTAGKFAPELFRELGHEVEELFCELDGTFPNHPANPEEYENVKDLANLVKEHKADLGLAFDGDGDRIGIIDENGKHYSADYLILLLARDLLSRNEGAKIVFDLKCSNMVEEEITKLGGIPIMSKTGHSFIEQEMKLKGALLGGEVSGHLFFKENYYGFDDAFWAGMQILNIISNSKKSFSKHFDDIPKTYNTPEIKASCPDDKKFDIIKKLVTRFIELYPNAITLDGVRVNLENGSWGAVRCSNTTPCLTMRFEAKTPEQLNEIQDIFAKELEKHPEIDMSWYKN